MSPDFKLAQVFHWKAECSWNTQRLWKLAFSLNKARLFPCLPYKFCWREEHKERRPNEKRLHWCLFSALMVDLGTSGCITLFHRHLTTKYLAWNTFPSLGSFYEHQRDVATTCYLTDSTFETNTMVFTMWESMWPFSAVCNTSRLLRKTDGRMRGCATPLTTGCSFHTSGVKRSAMSLLGSLDREKTWHSQRVTESLEETYRVRFLPDKIKLWKSSWSEQKSRRL